VTIVKVSCKIRHPKRFLERRYTLSLLLHYIDTYLIHLLTPNPPKGKVVSIDFPETNEKESLSMCLGFNELMSDQATLNKVKLR
jgi:hypothetical protein